MTLSNPQRFLNQFLHAGPKQSEMMRIRCLSGFHKRRTPEFYAEQIMRAILAPAASVQPKEGAA